jgi:hypothetical protein
MALNRGVVNALNVLGFRKISFIPEHFSKISIDHKFDTKLVEQWIEFNLNSRYAIQVKQGIDSNRKLVSITEIGMEDPKELTMLSLGCHYLHKQKEI